MRVTFIADQFVPPVLSGSTLVYETWTRMLAEADDLSAIFFTLDREPEEATHKALQQLCQDYLILPGPSRFAPAKTARALARFATGCLYAPQWVEEAGRGSIQQAVSEFLQRQAPDVVVISKLATTFLLGVEVLRSFQGIKILDLHDDFTARESMERGTLAHLLADHPVLRRHPSYRNARVRHLLSRHDVGRSRAQERVLLGLFDHILISSREEYDTYAASSGLRPGTCCHAPWPITPDGGQGLGCCPNAGPAEFDAGFIASDAPFNLEGLLHFEREILPIILKQRSGFRLLVAGGITAPYAMLNPPECITLLPRVEDVAEFYRRIAVGIVPLRQGTGVSLKTIEALRFSRPVVSSAAGVRGLDLKALPGVHLALTADTFAGTVCRILTSGPTQDLVPRALHRSFGPAEYRALLLSLVAAEKLTISATKQASIVSIADEDA